MIEYCTRQAPDAPKACNFTCFPAQNPALESDWYKPEGPGWTPATAKRWVHKLGNLCVLNVSQNSAVSNSNFSDKKALLFDEPMRQGLAAGLSAFSLDRVDVWNLAALEIRHGLLVQHLADRWGFGRVESCRGGDYGDDDENGDDDNGNDDGNDDANGGKQLLDVIDLDDAVPLSKIQGKPHADWCVYTTPVFCLDRVWFEECLYVFDDFGLPDIIALLVDLMILTQQMIALHTSI